jgi:hypothetical protein
MPSSAKRCQRLLLTDWQSPSTGRHSADSRMICAPAERRTRQFEPFQQTRTASRSANPPFTSVHQNRYRIRVDLRRLLLCKEIRRLSNQMAVNNRITKTKDNWNSLLGQLAFCALAGKPPFAA